MSASVYIKSMHPKTEIRPTPEAVAKILAIGWAGQLKIHGHRAQIHLPADPEKEVVVYNRQGRPHKKLLPEMIEVELRRILKPESDWTVIDAEWLKPENKLFLFDILKLNGENLRRLTYEDRYKLLPRAYLSPFVQTLPLLTTQEKCLAALASPEEHIEGLVFKALKSKGFDDTSIVRCRKRVSAL